jgi:hypothetical protein
MAHSVAVPVSVPLVRWEIGIADRDQARWVTWTTILGLMAAAALALVGGLPFDLPMPSYRLGVVTPTCGLTRGSTALVRGDVTLAWRYNPASFIVIAFGALGVARTAAGVLASRWIVVNCTRSRTAWILIGGSIATFWLYQQSNAEFIINSRL